MKYLIGIDLGTSGCKAVMYDQEGKKISSAWETYPLYQPHNGWAEQDPDDWASASKKAIAGCVKQAGVAKEDVAGVALSGQMHGLVMLDASNRALRKSLIWCDTRAQKECDEILSTYHDYVKYTLNSPVVGFTLPKLLWVLKHEGELREKIAHVMLPKDYVNFCLSGKFVSDVSDASGTGLFDVAKRTWSKEVLKAFDIPFEWWGEVKESYEVIGPLLDDVAEEVGLTTSTLVMAGAGDQAAAGLGNGIIKPGMASISLGTSGVVFMGYDKPRLALPGLHCFCDASGLWHGMAVTQGAGLSVAWFTKNIAPQYNFDQLQQMANEVPCGSDGLLFLPYLMGERAPHPSSSIRGGWLGLSSSHSLGHMYRAVLEGVSFSLTECAEALGGFEEDSKIYLSGGGAKSELWSQILADCLGHDVYVPDNPESGTRGAAIMVGVGSKIYKNVEEAVKALVPTTSRLIKYSKERHEIYKGLLPYYSECFDLLKGHCASVEEYLAKVNK